MMNRYDNNIIRRLFDFMAQKVCFTFAVCFISVLGASAAVPGMFLIWETIPYENPSYFYSEVILGIGLLFTFALIHWLLYGLGRLWGKRWEISELRILNDHVKSLNVWSDIPTSILKKISDLLERLPGMNFRMSMFLSMPVVIIMTVNNYVHLENPLYALYVFRGGCVAMITYIMFTYIITELITLNLRRETRLILADRDALKGTGFSSTLLIKFIFIISLMVTSMVITHGLASTKVVHSAFVTFVIFAAMNVIVGVLMCILIFASIMITLREIEEATNQLGDQQCARFISGSIDREFVNTSMGLYHAARKIIKFRNDLQDLNLTLEQKVEERTEQINVLSMTDPLTGSYNRRYLIENLPIEIKKAQRYKSSFSLVICDLDHFKKVNDKYGHQGGDQVLIAFVSCIKGTFRNDLDWVARYGGEEFIIALPETGANGAQTFAERLRNAIANKVILSEGKEIRITASFGVTGFDADTSAKLISIEDLVRKADKSLYQAKTEGRNRVVTCRM
jgi:diguanylate cyclase (GGDEF)-like protein